MLHKSFVGPMANGAVKIQPTQLNVNDLTRSFVKVVLNVRENLLSVVDSKNARVVTGLNEEQAKYIEDLLEPTNGVTDHLLPQCLGSIEERVLQLLHIIVGSFGMKTSVQLSMSAIYGQCVQ